MMGEQATIWKAKAGTFLDVRPDSIRAVSRLCA
jgi:hypothetical protein